MPYVRWKVWKDKDLMNVIMTGKPSKAYPFSGHYTPKQEAGFAFESWLKNRICNGDIPNSFLVDIVQLLKDGVVTMEILEKVCDPDELVAVKAGEFHWAL
jgi:hypothetical protein